MTNPTPSYETFTDEDADQALTSRVDAERPASPYPPALLKLDEDKLKEFTNYVESWLHDLKGSHQEKINQWTLEERGYRAKYEGDLTVPFIGASGIEVPLIAMGVDPVYARLDTGIFKGDRVIVLKSLRKSFTDDMPKIERWLHFVQKHKLKLRQVVSPRLLELCKHGTMVLKVCYDHESRPVQMYDDKYKVITKNLDSSGVRVHGVGLNDFLFPPRYQHIQDAPICFERIRMTQGRMRALEKSGKYTDIDEMLKHTGNRTTSTDLETEREHSAQHHESTLTRNEIDGLWEGHCDYDINDDGFEERVVFTYNEYTRTFCQLRLNWYFHQLKPYVVVPYITTSDSLYGIGLGEMISVFQIMLTKWERMAENNAYLANTRMFVGREGVVHEDALRIYCARVIKVNDPQSDLASLQIADIYQSTLMERQNIIGLAEKRTGISDYLTGRESPIVGSRATATSTLALIQEGTRRVEQVLENIRNGVSECMMMCFYLWIQYGIDPVTDIAFGDDEVADAVHRFFNTIDRDNIDGAIAIDLAAVDAANNKVQQQQAQLALIQIGMQYLEKIVKVAEMAIQSPPQLQEFLGEVTTASRRMFKDLYEKYDVTNAEQWLPDVEAFLARLRAGGAESGAPGGSEGSSGLSIVPGAGGNSSGSAPGGAPNGQGSNPTIPIAGRGIRSGPGPVAVA